MIELIEEQRVSLREFLATEVMGWHEVGGGSDTDLHYQIEQFKWKPIISKKRWLPDRDLNQAWQVALEAGFAIRLSTKSSDHFCWAYVYSVEPEDGGTLEGCEQADIHQPALALSVAVAKAKGWQP